MKKTWKDMEDEGVSPVIATILMVAITVVLAAVLYVMVFQLNVTPEFDGIGSIEAVDVRSNSSAEITFGTFGSNARPTELRFILEDRDGLRTTLTWPAPPDGDNYAMASSDADVSAIYRDFEPVANEVNAGDSIIVSGLAPGNHYSITMVTLEGNRVNLAGDTDFTLPT